MRFTETEFEDLYVFEPTVFADERGFFFESYNKEIFKKQNLPYNFVQDNQSFSKYGVIRGLHYQLNPYAQAKLVRALHGKILDVAVDLRKTSNTYGNVFSIELTQDNKKQLLIPPGFAHGFSVLSETAVVMYKCDAFYNKASEAGIIYNDVDLSIDWQISEELAIVSEKDKALPTFKKILINF